MGSFERAGSGLVASLVLMLAACGGGGGDAPAQSGTESLTALQVAVQDSMSSTSSGSFILSSYLPAGGLPVAARTGSSASNSCSQARCRHHRSS